MQVPFGKGYDERVTPNRLVGFNGYIEYGEQKFPLWVEDLTIPFGLAGDVGQSANTRTLFPRALKQPEITLACQAPSQSIYSECTEFIRRTQKGFSNLATLNIFGYNLPVLRGGHSPISADGYVRTIARRHSRFEYSPSFSFAFVVAKMKAPTAWADDPVQIRKLKSWQSIVEGIMAHDENAGFVEDPDRVPTTRNKNTPPKQGIATLPNGKVLPGP
jgi:hypothetical protein